MVMNNGNYHLDSMEVTFSIGRDPEAPKQEETDDTNDLCSTLPHQHLRLRWQTQDGSEPPFQVFVTEIPETGEWLVNQPYTDEQNDQVRVAWVMQNILAGAGMTETADGQPGFAIDPKRLAEALQASVLSQDELTERQKKDKKEDERYAGGLYL